jgi:hypothetical protein
LKKLNDEKITPYFMALAKQSNTVALLSDIRRDDNVDFIDNTEREGYITEYYREVYKKRDHRAPIGENNVEIDNFLGDVASTQT